jgi:hypothetical protein
MRRLAAWLLAVMLGLFASVTVAQSPAFAAWACPGGVGCVYDGQGGTGDVKHISVGAHGVNRCYNFSDAWDDRIESAKNDYGTYGSDYIWLYLYTGENCGGSSAPIIPGGEQSLGRGFANQIESFKLIAPGA